MLNLTLPDHKYACSKQTHAAASAYGTLTLQHQWLLDAINNGIYPPFMEVDSEGMVDGYSLVGREPEPALAVRLRCAIEAATRYYELLDGVTNPTELVETARQQMSDYIKTLDSIQL